MRILFTGSTGRQTKEEVSSRALDRINDPTIMVESLRASGHEVTRRPVRQGEDLSQYDLCIVGLGQFGSINYCGEVLNALYACAVAPRLLVLHEDWKIEGTMAGLEKTDLRAAVKKKWKDGKPFYGGADHPNLDLDLLEDAKAKILRGDVSCLVPAFDWGDKNIIRNVLRTSDVRNVDLTPRVIKGYGMTAVRPTLRRRAHVLAALGDFSSRVKKQRLTWPVEYFGHNGPKLDSELEVFHTCGGSWSVLCPEYPTAGSGWFRVRYAYAALNRTTIWTSDKDLRALGIQRANPETMTDPQLEDYAAHQAERILSYLWKDEDFDARLNAAVSAPVK